jgi:hypothetical protein
MDIARSPVAYDATLVQGPEGKSSWQELKAKNETFEILHRGVLDKAVKCFSVRKGNP